MTVFCNVVLHTAPCCIAWNPNQKYYWFLTFTVFSMTQYGLLHSKEALYRAMKMNTNTKFVINYVPCSNCIKLLLTLCMYSKSPYHWVPHICTFLYFIKDRKTPTFFEIVLVSSHILFMPPRVFFRTNFKYK